MVNTNQLLPVGSLKRKCIKKCFSGWVMDMVGNGRILTYKLALDVCNRLRKKFDLEKQGDDVEARRLHSLLKAARKRQLGKSKAMDEMETLPMPDCFVLEDCSDRYCVFLTGWRQPNWQIGFIGIKFHVPQIDGTRLHYKVGNSWPLVLKSKICVGGVILWPNRNIVKSEISLPFLNFPASNVSRYPSTT